MGCSATTQESAQRPLETSMEVLSCLPARLAQGLGGPFEVNDATGTLIDHLYKTRGRARLVSLERWAKLEAGSRSGSRPNSRTRRLVGPGDAEPGAWSECEYERVTMEVGRGRYARRMQAVARMH